MSKKVKFVLVGFGNMGQDWANILKSHSDAEIVGVVDVIDKSLIDAAKILKLDKNAVGKDLIGVLKHTKPDAVLDTSPPFNHSYVTTTAIKMGFHVLGEKPIALNIPNAKRIVRLSQKFKKIYMINQNYRWNPAVQALKKFILANNIGKIHSIAINYAQNFNFKDTFRYKIDHPLLVDMSVHHFDLVRSITNAKFLSVCCREFNAPMSKFKNGSSTIATFEMDNGVVFNYTGSWSDIGFDTSFMGTWRISGEKGTIVWDGYSNPKVQLKRNNKVIGKEIKLSQKQTISDEKIFAYELNNSLSRFIASIKTEIIPETWCGDNIYTLKMVLSAIESSKKAMPIYS